MESSDRTMEDLPPGCWEEVLAFVRKAIADDRERCAALIESGAVPGGGTRWRHRERVLAAAIRARPMPYVLDARHTPSFME